MRIAMTLSLLLSIVCACDPRTVTTDAKQAAATEALVSEANRQVGMPNITNFTERKFAKMIRELCDTEVATFTYIIDMHGKRHFLCESIGYGIPYSVQFTNPMKVEKVRSRSAGYLAALTLPQPEANGLFMPAGSSATWVLAARPDGGVSPIYVEPQILVSPFRLDSE